MTSNKPITVVLYNVCMISYKPITVVLYNACMTSNKPITEVLYNVCMSLPLCRPQHSNQLCSAVLNLSQFGVKWRLDAFLTRDQLPSGSSNSSSFILLISAVRVDSGAELTSLRDFYDGGFPELLSSSVSLRVPPALFNLLSQPLFNWLHSFCRNHGNSFPLFFFSGELRVVLKLETETWDTAAYRPLSPSLSTSLPLSPLFLVLTLSLFLSLLSLSPSLSPSLPLCLSTLRRQARGVVTVHRCK